MSQTTKNQIRVFIERAPEDGCLAGWMAQYTGPHAAEILDLFGTDTLPLPFLSPVPASTVIDTLQRSHPDVAVVLRDWVEVGTRPYVADEPNEPSEVIIGFRETSRLMMLKGKGYRTAWSGNGQICLVKAVR